MGDRTRLKILYFESALGKGVYTWRDGAAIPSSDLDGQRLAYEELARVVDQKLSDTTFAWGRLVRSPGHALIETPAVVPSEPANRVNVNILLSTGDGYPSDVSAAIKEAHDVLAEEGLSIDTALLTTGLTGQNTPPFGFPHGSNARGTGSPAVLTIVLAAIVAWIIYRLLKRLLYRFLK
jgi:hypothetical protein